MWRLTTNTKDINTILYVRNMVHPVCTFMQHACIFTCWYLRYIPVYTRRNGQPVYNIITTKAKTAFACMFQWIVVFFPIVIIYIRVGTHNNNITRTKSAGNVTI